jgi:hypothetical protein
MLIIWYNMADYDKAKESLDLTVRYLEGLNPSATASLKEGLEETLYCAQIKIKEGVIYEN